MPEIAELGVKFRNCVLVEPEFGYLEVSDYLSGSMVWFGTATELS